VIDIDIVEYFDSIPPPTSATFLTAESRMVSSDGHQKPCKNPADEAEWQAEGRGRGPHLASALLAHGEESYHSAPF
jgi:hypothetical protein